MAWHNYDCLSSGVDCPLGCSCARCDNLLTIADVHRALEHEAWKKPRTPHGEPKEEQMFHNWDCRYSGKDCEIGCECEGCPYYARRINEHQWYLQNPDLPQEEPDEGAFDAEMEEVE